MNTDQSKSRFFTEDQSLKLIREMIQVSQRKLRNDGILFILWGWIMFIYYIIYYIESKMITTYQMEKILNYTGTALILVGLAYTIYYLLKQRKRVQTYIGVSLRYVWISLIVSLMLVNLIQHNVMHQINFELQHPIFMVLIAFAIVVTGGIIRFRLIIAGGIVFGLLALFSSFQALEEQLLIEAIAWAIAFVIPGHILYSKRKK